MTDEQNRLQAVSRFKHLDERITKDLNDIANLAAQICNTPVALITLLDEDVQWFKASYGTEVKNTSREVSLCNHTIRQEELLIVQDTTRDDRFQNNPLVSNDPHVKFYAGIKLATKDNFAVGSLCVIDFEAKTLNEHQQNSLVVLSRQVINLMELHWSLSTLDLEYQKTQQQKLAIEASEIKLNAIFNSSKDTHILVGANMEILAFNKAAAHFACTKYKRKLSLGDSIVNYTDPQIFKQFLKSFFACAERQDD
ncbi:MAG: domain S-box protein [Mucilaginibacter sp.]|nr:domain S-box protein [Mucilaginibacter sp.]